MAFGKELIASAEEALRIASGAATILIRVIEREPEAVARALSPT